jgi:hypothetical protein
MSVGNGGYSIDKKSIEQCFEQNEKDHTAIAKQNHEDHAEIRKVLDEIKSVYCPDVIILKTQVKMMGTALLLTIPAVLGLIAKSIVSWVEK